MYSSYNGSSSYRDRSWGDQRESTTDRQSSINNSRKLAKWFFEKVIRGDGFDNRSNRELVDAIDALKDLHEKGSLPDRDGFTKIMLGNLNWMIDQRMGRVNGGLGWWESGAVGNISEDHVRQESTNRAAIICGYVHDLIASELSCDAAAYELVDFSDGKGFEPINGRMVSNAVKVRSDDIKSSALVKNPKFKELMSDSGMSEFEIGRAHV